MNYKIFRPGVVDAALFREVCANHSLHPEGSVSMLPYGAQKKIGWETRQLYFGLAQAEDGFFCEEPVLQAVADARAALETTRIVSFGRCNVACGYCKRDCQFIGDDGTPIITTDIKLTDLFGLAEGAHSRGEVVRFSGGDPVVFPRETLALGEYLFRRHGAKVSIAHNGSGPAWVRKLTPYLSSAAIDLKAVPEDIAGVMGVHAELGERLFANSVRTQRILSEAGVTLDVRTPIFGHTRVEDMVRLGEVVAGNNPRTTFWTWRLYKPVHGCSWQVPDRETVFAMLDSVSRAYPHLWMGVRAKWHAGGMAYWKGGLRIVPMDMDDTEAAGSGNRLKVAA